MPRPDSPWWLTDGYRGPRHGKRFLSVEEVERYLGVGREEVERVLDTHKVKEWTARMVDHAECCHHVDLYGEDFQ